MECDLFSLHFPVLDIDFVSTKDNGHVLQYSDQVPVPAGHIFVRDTRRDIEEDDSTLSSDIVTVTETSKLFLAGCVPHVESDSTFI